MVQYRPRIIEASSFALIAYEWVRPLAQWIGQRRCLEIMCGRGVLARALRDCGVTVVATDDQSWGLGEQWWRRCAWVEVEKLDCVAAIEMYGPASELVICSWPPPEDPSAHRALLKMREVAPNTQMIFIGEENPLVNADAAFFHDAVRVADDAFYAAVSNFKRAPGIRDFPILLR